MPKVKTNSSAKKRFRVTGSGKLKRKQAFKRHCLANTKKSKKTKRMLTAQVLVAKSDQAIVKKLLNI